jgi:hypothetical protein
MDFNNKSYLESNGAENSMDFNKSYPESNGADTKNLADGAIYCYSTINAKIM